MKLILLSLCVFLSSQAYTKDIEIESMSKDISKNLIVLEKANQLYQVNETVELARRNLLPRLNLWNIISIPFDWTNAIGVIQDIAPFLVPANWFAIKEQKAVFKIHELAFKSLAGNGVLQARSLYVKILSDEELLRLLQATNEQFKKVYDIVKTQSIFFPENLEFVRILDLQLLSLDQDRLELEQLISKEKNFLKRLLTIQNSEKLQLKAVTYGDIASLPELHTEDFLYRVLNESTELLEYDELSNLALLAKRKANFIFLGTSSLHTSSLPEGLSDIPIQNGLGFGIGNTKNIIKAQKEIIRIKKQATEMLLISKLDDAVNEYNSNIQNYKIQQAKIALAEAVLNSQYDRLKLGGKIDPLSLLEATKRLLEAQFQAQGFKFSFFKIQDEISRLTYNGIYEQLPNFRDVLAAQGKE